MDSDTEKMIMWKVSPRYKKSVIDVEIFRNGEREITMETGWRWGHVVLLVPEGIDLIAELKPEENNRVQIDGLGYDILDREFDDGCWEEWDLDALEGDEEEAFQEAWDEDSHEGIENLGWEGWDSELFFDGPLDVENLGEYVAPVYDDVEEDENEESSGGWPN